MIRFDVILIIFSSEINKIYGCYIGAKSSIWNDYNNKLVKNYLKRKIYTKTFLKVNSSVRKIYIFKTQSGPVAKNATSRPYIYLYTYQN